MRQETTGSVPSSPVPLTDSNTKEWLETKPHMPASPGFTMSGDTCQEDQEVLEIVKQGEHMYNTEHRMQLCDSVLQEFQVSY